MGESPSGHFSADAAGNAARGIIMHKVLLSVAPVQATPHRMDPRAIAEDVYECWKEGAAMVHLHVRDAQAALTPDLSLTEETVRLIREKCDIIIEISTGGISTLSIEERCAPCAPDWVEANSLNVGSVNLGRGAYQNQIDDVRYCVGEILRHGKVPETEVFELGMIETLKNLTREFPFRDPLLLALVFGHGGEMPATKQALLHMLVCLDETFGSHVADRAPALAPLWNWIVRQDDGMFSADSVRQAGRSPEQPAEGSHSAREVLWGYTQAGRRDFAMMRFALEQGADSLRVGFEDSDYLDPQTRVKTNAPLIGRAAALVRETGSEPMSPAEARALLGIPAKK